MRDVAEDATGIAADPRDQRGQSLARALAERDEVEPPRARQDGGDARRAGDAFRVEDDIDRREALAVDVPVFGDLRFGDPRATGRRLDAPEGFHELLPGGFEPEIGGGRMTADHGFAPAQTGHGISAGTKAQPWGPSCA